MSFIPYRHAWSVPAIAALALSGCGPSPDAAAQSGNATPVARVSPTPVDAVAKAAVAPADGQLGAVPPTASLVGVADTEFPGEELPAERFQGRWTVIDVAADAFAADDFKPERRLIGRSFTYTPHLATWYDASGVAEEAARCPDPMIGIVQPTVNARNLARAFRSAWAKFQLPPADVGPPHNFVCDTADGAGFQPGDGILFPVGHDRIVMNWYNHNILLLRRVKP